ncbi:hypothetical protein BH24ACI1_BH24ACI1_23960 [soil metagenome]
MKLLRNGFLGIGLTIALFSGLAAAGENSTKREKRAQEPLKITAVQWGPTQEIVDAAKRRVERSAAVQNALKGAKYRILSFDYIDNSVEKSQPSTPPKRFRIVFYDYTNDRTLVAENDFAGTETITVSEEFFQPNSNDEEFNEAVRILTSDARFSSFLKGEQLRAFQPMPPVTVLSGTRERLVNVGLGAQGDSAGNEVVSVSLRRGAVIRYDKGAPDTSKAEPDACGIPAAPQGSTGRGVAGQYQLTISQGTTPLWEMLVIRPSSSSGTMGSGIELRDVKYRGKSVMKRGHAPVLNVEYTPSVCGPYRDWQYAEGFFDAPAAGANDPAPGIRILAAGQIAQTALDSGNDTGNFQGVAIYTQNDETVMVTEMNAGWYRYIMEWRFAGDGTIRPRYGFGATDNSCVCSVHNHHVYWRFDFDIVSPTNEVFQVERGRKFMLPITKELTTLKNLQTKRSIIVQNSTSDEAYMLAPNETDGVADNYGRSDIWVLKYKNVNGGNNVQNEIDDGWPSIGGTCTATSGSCINIDKFINNESVLKEDVVVWYGAHFVHSDGENRLEPNRLNPSILSGSHVVGPDIRPIRW